MNPTKMGKAKYGQIIIINHHNSLEKLLRNLKNDLSSNPKKNKGNQYK